MSFAQLDAHHTALTAALMGIGAFVLVILLFISAPYGRHTRAGWGPTLPSKWGWLLMESPTLAVFVPVYMAGRNAHELVPLVFLGLWLAHYGHRTLLYPFGLSSPFRPIPASIVSMGVLFNSINALLIARFISHIGSYDADWLTGSRFLVGIALFISGYAINRWADKVLRSLRKGGDEGYSIPRGGLFEYVSCPNYFGEILEWVGFATLTWSLPGLAFAWYTAANLLPRALSHHRFYQEHFPDYPEGRKALIPFVL